MKPLFSLILCLCVTSCSYESSSPVKTAVSAISPHFIPEPSEWPEQPQPPPAEVTIVFTEFALESPYETCVRTQYDALYAECVMFCTGSAHYDACHSGAAEYGYGDDDDFESYCYESQAKHAMIHCRGESHERQPNDSDCSSMPNNQTCWMGCTCDPCNRIINCDDSEAPYMSMPGDMESGHEPMGHEGSMNNGSMGGGGMGMGSMGGGGAGMDDNPRYNAVCYHCHYTNSSFGFDLKTVDLSSLRVFPSYRSYFHASPPWTNN